MKANNRPLILVDVEADGPYAPDYSMICFAAVLVEPGLTKTFFGKTEPISPDFKPEALAVSGYLRAEHEAFPAAAETMQSFDAWLQEAAAGKQPSLISDNPLFDGGVWLNYYCWKFLGRNPFGHSGRRIGDLYCGLKRDMRKNEEWRKLCVTPHDHNPLNDALGNAEALLKILEE